MASKFPVNPAACRRRAAECHKMAENAPSPHVRDTLADIERMWNRLAVEAEVSQAMYPASSKVRHSDLTRLPSWLVPMRRDLSR